MDSATPGKRRRNRRRGRGRGAQQQQQPAGADTHILHEPAQERVNSSLQQGPSSAVASCTVCMETIDAPTPAHRGRRGRGRGRGRADGTGDPGPAASVAFPGCTHPYCAPCLAAWIKSTSTDRSLAFPTKCAHATCRATLCPDTLDALAMPDLTPAHRACFRDRFAVEVQGHATRCPATDCGALIYVSDAVLAAARILPGSPEAGNAPDLPELRVQCLACRAFLCYRCRLPSHRPLTCSELAALPLEARHHPEDFAVLRMGHVLQWKRCPGCAVLVDRRDGCNFIKCACGVGFCYRCGARYVHLRPTEGQQHGQPGCACDLFDIPPDPLAAVGGDVDRLVHAPPAAANPEPVVGPVQAMAAQAPAAAPRAAVAVPAPLAPPTAHDLDTAARVLMLLQVSQEHPPDVVDSVARARAFHDRTRAVRASLLAAARQAAELAGNLDRLRHLEAHVARNRREQARLEQLQADPEGQLAPEPDVLAYMPRDTLARVWDALWETTLRTLERTVADLAAFLPTATRALDLDAAFVQRVDAWMAPRLGSAGRVRDRAWEAEVYLAHHPWPRCPDSGLRLMAHGRQGGMDNVLEKTPRYLRAFYERLECCYCGRQFADFVALITHVYATEDHEAYLCCNRPFKEVRGLVQHLREAHGDQGLGRLEAVVPRV